MRPDNLTPITVRLSVFFGLLVAAAVFIAPRIDAAEPMAKPTDQEFVNKAANSGMTEVELGKLAAAKGGTAAVKSFGEQMVKDHGAANDELKVVATKHKLALPATPSPDKQAKIDEMKQKDGAAFDAAYLPLMVENHEKSQALFRAEHDATKEPDLRDFTGRTLPTIEKHLTMARGMSGTPKP